MERVAEHFSQILDTARSNSWVRNEDLTFREIDDKEGYIRGILYLHGGCALHIAEYVEIKNGRAKCIKYRYQLQDRKEKLLARWDNAPHHKEIATFPNHKHRRDGEIVPSPEMNIFLILSLMDDILKND